MTRIVEIPFTFFTAFDSCSMTASTGTSPRQIRRYKAGQQSRPEFLSRRLYGNFMIVFAPSKTEQPA
jgi:hypothetical protein